MKCDGKTASELTHVLMPGIHVYANEERSAKLHPPQQEWSTSTHKKATLFDKDSPEGQAYVCTHRKRGGGGQLLTNNKLH
jgi:hypothetical protein